MPDPAKTPEEIEDVLASVRRLVSDHAPKHESAVAQPTPTPAPTSTEAPALAEALVLTPSFRVTDPEDPWVPVATPQAPEDVPADGPPLHAGKGSVAADAEDLIAEIVTAAASPKDTPEWQLDDRLAHFDAVGGAEENASPPKEWADDHTDEASEEEIADLIRLDGAEATAADFESETGDDNWPEGGADAALLTLVARRDPVPGPRAAKDAPIEAAADDMESDAVPAAPAFRIKDDVKVQAEEGLARDDLPEQDAEAEMVSDTPIHTPVDEHTDAPTGAEDHAEDLPLDETAVADAPDEAPLTEAPKAEAEVQSDLDGPPIFSRAHDPAMAPDDVPVEDLGDTPSPFTFPETDEGILDEDTLREIIVEVVREELQGVLGQRITRNVRKMVRREIRLALAAEDLE